LALISDDELRERTGAASTKLGRSFSWEKEAVKYVDAFDGLNRGASRTEHPLVAPVADHSREAAPSP